MEITDKITIITGASSGIGRAAARQMASEGAKVVLAARAADALGELQQELPGSLAAPTDVRQDDDVKNLIKTTLNEYGRIHILINGAGRGMWKRVEEIDITEYQELFDLNVLGYLRLMQAVIPVMRKQGGGTIVNVSSMLTRSFYPNLAGYASTKYAMNSLTLSARAELEKDGITVSLIRPKLVEIDFGRHALHPEPDALRSRQSVCAACGYCGIRCGKDCGTRAF
ncbi:MAG TPA: SDR family NAD(P)-dependent oxidoreductase [Dehalococcoidia bacterium]|nr:SDR family NAD(P)-dependent oxidoreductase [Dehalococcoidia bacterium]